MKKQRLDARMDPDLMAAVKRLARDQGVTMTHMLDRGLRLLLDQHAAASTAIPQTEPQ